MSLTYEQLVVAWSDGRLSREQVIAWFQDHRWLQHQALFAHRHSCEPALFHQELVELFWSETQRLGVFAFRGGAKSTIAEEFIALGAAELAFRNCVILGASEGRAAERIAAVKRELERNEDLVDLYGEQVGDVWTQVKLVTRNNVCIQALGKEQDIRGLKHLDWRPDLLVIDDFEDRDNVATPEGRRKTFSWFMSDLVPACQPSCKIRLLATPMDPESVPMQLSEDRAWSWRRYPIVRPHPKTGVEEPTWPDLFSAEWIEETRRQYGRTGQAAVWAREFLCEAVSPADQVFRAEDIRIEPHVRTYEPVYVAIDPARTVRRETSAMTGIIVAMWVGAKLVVLEDCTGFLRPDQIIDLVFELDERYAPAAIAIEENGLEEWLNQPLRHEMLRRGRLVPVQAVRAPRSKPDFIRQLQPFFRNGDVVFAAEMPELRAQLLSFPRGRIDGPNALAYILTLRPGVPIYDDFAPLRHVSEHIIWPRGEPLWLAMNAANGITTGALAGRRENRIAVLGDWVAEGDPGATAASLLTAASMRAGGAIRVVVPPLHFDSWNNTGLVQALRVQRADLHQGLDPLKGREQLRRRMQQMPRDMPAFLVGAGARHTLAALSSGYACRPGHQEPAAGLHATLMTGLESAVALMCLHAVPEDSPMWAETGDGRRYLRYATALEGGATRYRSPYTVRH
jgi:hypothetical protein